jgi:hypothetical protein
LQLPSHQHVGAAPKFTNFRESIEVHVAEGTAPKQQPRCTSTYMMYYTLCAVQAGVQRRDAGGAVAVGVGRDLGVGHAVLCHGVDGVGVVPRGTA